MADHSPAEQLKKRRVGGKSALVGSLGLRTEANGAVARLLLRFAGALEKLMRLK